MSENAVPAGTRRKIAFVGSECYPFVKTGGLGDVMYALPRALIRNNCEVRVILPLYNCMPMKYKEKLEWKGSFMMDLTMEGRTFFVGIMETEMDGVIYDFIDNKEFFDWGNPYTGLWEDIPKYCYFSKASLAVLNYLEWIPDVIHCHDWQASLVPMYLKTRFNVTPVGKAKSVLTIHNLRFQGICSIPHLKYWSGLPDYLFNYPVLKINEQECNMFKGGLAFADWITTVSATYAEEIQTPSYGEGLDSHLRYHQPKLSGIVNGIDTDIWNSDTDTLLEAPYNAENFLERKPADKQNLQSEMRLDQVAGRFVLGLVSRLTDQKGLDLIDAIFPDLMDGNTQVVVLGTGDPRYENAFRYYEQKYRGFVSANITYNEGIAHKIYAGADAFLVPSLFEPCGLTQLIAMRYGTVPIVRETGGLKDTVQPYNAELNDGNGFTFDKYLPAKLLEAVNNARNLFFGDRWHWDEMVRRNMQKDVSWEKSAAQYAELYESLCK
jgi:starch synthase